MRGWMVNLGVDKLHPHPDNPRKELGDLSELADSIRQNGIFQNLTVVPDDKSMESFTVIIGHRRLAAAQLAGLLEVPCAIVEMDRREQLQTMLLENMQRSDLTPWEQAQGFQMMIDLGDTVDEIAEKSGFSRKTVKSRLKMAELDQDTLKQVSAERQISIGDLDELAKIEDIAVRNATLSEIGTPNFKYRLKTAIRFQEVQKVLPDARKFLKYLKCKPISQQESWNGQYVRVDEAIDVRVWVGEAVLPPKAQAPVFYFLDDKSGYLIFFTKRPDKPPESPESPETLEQKRKIKEAWDGLNERAEVAFQLRHNFIKNLRCSERNREKILFGALIASTVNAFYYIGIDRDSLTITLNLPNDGKVHVAEELTLSALAALKNPRNCLLPMAVYALFNDSPKECCASGYSGDWPQYRRSLKLSALYDWLASLGYVISDEEQQLLDGTHELFRNSEEA